MFQRFFNSIKSSVFSPCSLTVRQFLKFSIVGGICTIIDFVIYLVLTRYLSIKINYLWANFLATASAATINFIWNRKWTFRVSSKKIFSQYLKFWVAVVLGILLYQWILYFSVEKIKILDLIGKIIGAISAWVLRFFLNKFWTFKK